ncbi:glutamine--tRNA ligase [Candidatus Nardonella dryophthoridicola]|uniref:Glutamine--tRNA ligase n=1 Tax=endosymbiont of Rhynchophorus ferrugineus TaxID=1972133 RepID=A0A2Z5T7P7_9GAMM|nr:glutamine--tRNA ligase [Candidatus Nardonella dryophthoridicola]BBA85065.1 glutamine--tRNA ligase [endosymbiont of Rhynchophorus ferrugineus]
MKNNFIFKIINEDLKKKKHLKIKTRFSPEPNGYLHIGHIKSIFLNYFISKKYNGIFNLRIDDTNPYTSKKRYVDCIIKDLKWLNIKFDCLKYSSDYFKNIYNFAIYLIKNKLAYIDSLDKKNIRKYRGNFYNLGINSPYRNRDIEENLYLFNKMKNGFFNENKICLRLKMNMRSKFIILRDPIIYRVKFEKHFRTNYDWIIYPTYDFSHCICDYLEKITHSLCTLEFVENNIIYKWILNNININKEYIPTQYEFSRFNIEYNILSKRKINNLINNNLISNEKDKRLLTIFSIRKRGFDKNSIINIFKNIDINKNESIYKFSIFTKNIRNSIEKDSLRLISIFNPVLIIIKNLNSEEYINIPNNPYYDKYGYRVFIFTKYIYIDYIDFIKYFYDIKNNTIINSIIKLKYSYIIKPINFYINNNNKIVFFCKYYKNTLNKIFLLNKKVDCIIHWLSHKNIKKAKVYIYKNLFTYKNINNVKNYINKLNNNSIYNIYVYIENNKNILNNKIYQLERIGFFNIKLKKNILLYLIVEIKNNKFI